MINQSRLKELFTYTPDGKFTRNKNGKEVKCSVTKGQRYLRINVEGKPYTIHRMVFLYHYGYLPKVTDHIDGNRMNNKIENLREVTQQENCLNSKHRATSKSPFKNVYLQSPTKDLDWKRNWVVSLMVKGKRIYIGSFKDLDLANLVAHEARAKYHGAFARNF
jgi:hypothetical protein